MKIGRRDTQHSATPGTNDLSTNPVSADDYLYQDQDDLKERNLKKKHKKTHSKHKKADHKHNKLDHKHKKSIAKTRLRKKHVKK